MSLRVAEDVEHATGDKRRYAQMWIDYGINRSVVKRNVMTFGYGSNVNGMADQLDEDVMERLPETHPFGDEGHAASWYLAAHTFKAIVETVRLPAKAKSYLKKLARALAKENKPVCWTPCGVSVC